MRACTAIANVVACGSSQSAGDGHGPSSDGGGSSPEPDTNGFDLDAIPILNAEIP